MLKKVRPKTRLEKKFVDDILLPRLKKLPRSWWFKPPTLSIRGIPDVIGCLDGRLIALECKRRGARADPSREKLQRYVCGKIRDAGGIAFERVDEENIENVFEFLLGKPKGAA